LKIENKVHEKKNVFVLPVSVESKKLRVQGIWILEE
jgi:hypothetical protein